MKWLIDFLRMHLLRTLVYLRLRCASPNHGIRKRVPGEATFACEGCGRMFCGFCEGGWDPLCDGCWGARRKT